MAKPPAGSTLLFGALADSGRIRRRKNGKFRMVLKGIDEMDWFTDRPDRVAGEWSPKKLIRKWDGLFGGVEPNAQATFELSGNRKLVTFEMFKPKLSDSNQKLSFKIRGIGKKNKDLLTGLRNKRLSDASLFIDESLPACLPDCQFVDLTNANLNGASLKDSNLTNAKLNAASLIDANLNGATLIGANLNGANLNGANLTDDAYLAGATLIGANLNGANLNGAYLAGANLTSANLNSANLNSVFMYNTICPDGTKNSGNSPCTTEQLNLA